MLSSSPPHPSLEIPGGSTSLSLSLEMLKKGQKSTTLPQFMRSSFLGEAPQQCFEQGLSQKCSSVLTSLKTGQQIPPMLSERSSSLLGIQTSPLTSGSTLSRDMQSSLPKSLEPTTPLMSTQNSPRTLGTCSGSLLQCPSSPRSSKPMETGLLHLERPSKQSLMPCQDETQSMLPLKHICLPSLHPSPPDSTLESLTSTRPSDFEQPIRSTFASLSLPGSTNSRPFISPHLVWV